jgi:iron complex transport system substrate-binding protein
MKIRTLSLFLCLAILHGAFASESNHSRIVTIGGAATEIVFALGAGDGVVAVDLSSTFPPKVDELPKVGYVRAISPEGVLSMEPDLIVATGALGPAGARRSIEQFPIDSILLPELKTLAELTDSIQRVAEHLEAEAKGRALTTQIMEQLKLAASRSLPEETERPSVVFLLQPPAQSSAAMAGGKNTRAHTVIEMAGGRNAAASLVGFQTLASESLLALNPDVILVGQSEGHGGSPAAIEAMLNDPALSAVAAVRNEAVHPVPLDDLAFGPRLGEAVLRWNGLINPKAKGEPRP